MSTWFVVAFGIVLPVLLVAVLMAGLVLESPRCGPDSPHGPRIGSVILIAGCP